MNNFDILINLQKKILSGKLRLEKFLMSFFLQAIQKIMEGFCFFYSQVEMRNQELLRNTRGFYYTDKKHKKV